MEKAGQEDGEETSRISCFAVSEQALLQPFRLSWLTAELSRAKQESCHTVRPAHPRAAEIRAMPRHSRKAPLQPCPCWAGEQLEAISKPLLSCESCSAHSICPCARPRWLQPYRAYQFFPNEQRGRLKQPSKGRQVVAQIWCQLNRRWIFLVAGACHSREEQCKDATGHVFSMALEMQLVKLLQAFFLFCC